MHHCLRIAEIAQLICDFVSEDRYEELDNTPATRSQQLFALALTCQGFRYPARACLWNSIPNIDPIIKCAGRDMWRMDEQVLYLSRDILPSDLATMKKYANMVRSFGVDDETSYGYRREPESAAQAVWIALQRVLQGARLFLNLRNLYFNHKDETFTGLFDVQNLVNLIAVPSRGLVDLTARIPGLTSLVVERFEEYGGVTAFLQTLMHLPNLSRLVMKTGFPTLLLAFNLYGCSLRFLRLDHFWWPEDFDLQILYVPSVLENIEIGFDNTLDAIKFMTCFSISNKLRSLAITIRMTSTPFLYGHWPDVYLSFKKHAKYLKKLDFSEQPCIRFDSPQSNRILAGALTGDLPMLTHINISNLRGYTITDEDIKQITKGLPLLEEFHLLSHNSLREGNRFGTTIACLGYFAQNCPSLLRLSIAFDARVHGKLAAKILEVKSSLLAAFTPSGRPATAPTAWGTEVPFFPVSTSRGLNLISLDVSVSYVKDPQAAASFIFNTFPNISCIGWASSNKDRSWEEVFRHLRSYTNGKIRRTATMGT